MKGQILKALREGDGFLSGELLSKRLGISRVAVWKHIHSLQKDGYTVEASPSGYHLLASPDMLLPCEFPDFEHKVYYFLELSSTMDKARELARRGAEEGTIIIAEKQEHGRGRLNREWLSAQGGIYFTLILRPRISPSYAPRITLMASIAVANTIRELFGLDAEVKWPNDVLLKGKKVCGILAEMDAEMDIVNFVNLGMGINANNSIHPFEKTATSLKQSLGKEISRKDVFNSVLAEIDKRQDLLTKEDLIEEWKRLAATLDKDVSITSPGEKIVGRVVDIDSNGALIIEERDGSRRTIIAGDCMHLT